MKSSRATPAADGRSQIDITIMAFGDGCRASIDCRHGIICRAKFTDAAVHDAARLREGPIDPDTAAWAVWADGAWRPAEKERFLARIGRGSRPHRRELEGEPMLERTARAAAKTSAVRARVQHPLARRKKPTRLVIRTIAMDRAEAPMILTTMACTTMRWRRLDGRACPHEMERTRRRGHHATAGHEESHPAPPTPSTTADQPTSAGIGVTRGAETERRFGKNPTRVD